MYYFKFDKMKHTYAYELKLLHKLHPKIAMLMCIMTYVMALFVLLIS
jgi:hypothetical protein